MDMSPAPPFSADYHNEFIFKEYDGLMEPTRDTLCVVCSHSFRYREPVLVQIWNSFIRTGDSLRDMLFVSAYKPLSLTFGSLVSYYVPFSRFESTP